MSSEDISVPGLMQALNLAAAFEDGLERGRRKEVLWEMKPGLMIVRRSRRTMSGRAGARSLKSIRNVSGKYDITLRKTANHVCSRFRQSCRPRIRGPS